MERGNNMLLEEVGEIIPASGITSQSIATRLQYGYAPIVLLDNLFNAAIVDMQYKPVDISKLGLEIPYKETIDAIKESFLFKVVSTIEKTVKCNIAKGLPLKRIQLDLDSYVYKFCNKHFKYRKMQLDCEYMLQAINSELCIFASSNPSITAQFTYDSTINLRANTRHKSALIANEITALKRIKDNFTFSYKNINILLYDLASIAYKLYNASIVNNTNDFDI